MGAGDMGAGLAGAGSSKDGGAGMPAAASVGAAGGAGVPPGAGYGAGATGAGAGGASFSFAKRRPRRDGFFSGTVTAGAGGAGAPEVSPRPVRAAVFSNCGTYGLLRVIGAEPPLPSGDRGAAGLWTSRNCSAVVMVGGRCATEAIDCIRAFFCRAARAAFSSSASCWALVQAKLPCTPHPFGGVGGNAPSCPLPRVAKHDRARTGQSRLFIPSVRVSREFGPFSPQLPVPRP